MEPFDKKEFYNSFSFLVTVSGTKRLIELKRIKKSRVSIIQDFPICEDNKA